MKKRKKRILERSVRIWVVLLGITGMLTLLVAHATRASEDGNNPMGQGMSIGNDTGNQIIFQDGVALPSVDAFKSAVLNSVLRIPSISLNPQEYFPVHRSRDFRLAVFDRSGVYMCFKNFIRP